MRGGDVLMQSLAAHGVEKIFGNPGTTENSVLDRLIDHTNIDYIVALHESIAVAAASFYAQASGKTPVVNLHVAPGLGNAIGMMYGALKANSPMLVTAGQQDTRMRLNEPLLSHDLVAMAKPVTKFSAEPQSADEIAPMLRRAFSIANEFPKGPVFVALPVNVMEQETLVGASAQARPANSIASRSTITAAVNLISTSRAPCIITGDDPARSHAGDALVALAEGLGAPVYHEGLRAQCAFPHRHRSYRGRVAFNAAQTAKMLGDHDLMILVGGPFFEDIWFDGKSPFPAEAKILQIENSTAQLGFNFQIDLGVCGALDQSLGNIASALASADEAFNSAATKRNAVLDEAFELRRTQTNADLERQRGDAPIAPIHALELIAENMPTDAALVDESITSYGDVAKLFDFRGPGDYFSGRGGGIGQGIAGAIGVQLAFPTRTVVALSGDGSAMYSIQALWSAAHHALPIVFIILSNREYRVLKHNLDTYRHRFNVAAEKPYPHMDLSNPNLDFCAMATGMGVASARVSRASEIATALADAVSANAPYLIQIDIAGLESQAPS